MSKILVTGGKYNPLHQHRLIDFYLIANGFIAAQILIASLKANYTVVAQVRSQRKADETRIAMERAIPSNLSNLSFVIVPTIESNGAFDEVIKNNDFDAVLHTATPFHYNL